MTTSLLDGDWQQRLAEIASKYEVPGAALGIALGDDTLEVAYGATSVDTGVEIRTDTLFEIGSISKVWAATVVMALVDAGKLDLDTPAAIYLPEFQLADADATRQVTVRHLLTHTSGIEGDFFRGFGLGDDCLKRFVAALADLPPVGATWSYCNAGINVAARVVERVSGQAWDTALKDLVFSPLGLTHTVTLAEEALAHTLALGHVRGADDLAKLAPPVMFRSHSPGGGIVSSVGDVLRFARMHLAGGVASDGTRVLGAETVAAMQEHQVAPPSPYLDFDGQGLGWQRFHSLSADLIGQDGYTWGQRAYLRLVPNKNMAVVLLTNSGYSRDLYRDLIGEVLGDLAGVEMPQPRKAPDTPVEIDVTPYVGTYRSHGVSIEVWSERRGARMRKTQDLSDIGVPESVQEYDLVPIHEGLYLVREPDSTTWQPVTFHSLDDGPPYVFFGGRATRKVS
ncbi:serine hydrolase [Mesorhizobium sp.]|uniref:serine hydrolase domain-containing protein n=1 Tax=Mesorhizobium sp. TaxID=1871066 RepID=UPI001200AB5B|nr:serine hydrolase domain-containing protein [Mesorhizobium sp.]TIS97414.1 MAG: beta-lactamase family protein [Mesorhizobium sp.]